jgi:hypothetical protein
MTTTPPARTWTRSTCETSTRLHLALEPMIEAAGFGIREAEYSDDGFLAEYPLTAVDGIEVSQ